MSILGTYMVPHPPLIIPEVGEGKERGVAEITTAFHHVAERISEQKPETIIVISPHQIMYRDYFHISPGKRAKGDFWDYGAEGITISADYDREFIANLEKLAIARDFPAGTEGEQTKRLDHGTMIPLYFINKYYRDYQVVRIGLSGLSLTEHYTLGQIIKETVQVLEKDVVIIASGDLSHRLKDSGPYGYNPAGPKYDQQIMEVMGSADFEKLFDFSETFLDEAGECGHRAFTIMAGTLDRTAVSSDALAYQGPFGVGYGICTYKPLEKDLSRNFKEQYLAKEKLWLDEHRTREDIYVKLARQAIELYVTTGQQLTLPEDLPSEFYETTAGTFVSLKKDGRLRGCIGTLQATKENLGEEIIENALSASTRDPRFDGVSEDELDKLIISVDVLGPMEAITSEADLDVKKYGVVVTSGYKRGLLLPNLEGIDTIAAQIKIAKNKASITEDEEYSLERFEVVRHE
ncbi:AmmeMemoRadiSam system protein A [Ohessyouella blattaphilus]|uniref:AmmeMemoRadiSam system protein A n=1 Tax=Ohessyouella blattaphilus TaxID=2949333 RepID=A0ABT1EKJ7_9FIRM|nr:AmmeMemoRadiSam system protein A [Ohessyouella blattaphilus]MCP1110191.1 AmmeMemoRadiSam system protein A [Ohessyouella blattaphilus]MCR8563585.1 AmmeMemoRadiSam system protein A [Ohessyouella blattaphilus]